MISCTSTPGRGCVKTPKRRLVGVITVNFKTKTRLKSNPHAQNCHTKTGPHEFSHSLGRHRSKKVSHPLSVELIIEIFRFQFEYVFVVIEEVQSPVGTSPDPGPRGERTNSGDAPMV